MQSAVRLSTFGRVEKLPCWVQVHFPFPTFPQSTLADGLQEALDLGLCSHVGVCNYERSQLDKLHGLLEKKGTALVTNQVGLPAAWEAVQNSLGGCSIFVTGPFVRWGRASQKEMPRHKSLCKQASWLVPGCMSAFRVLHVSLTSTGTACSRAGIDFKFPCISP